uniref:Uncharacterized protein n=1 Tax=Trichuris muris TaxID=70415 RepID=A0A5S6R028_TRIMR
MAWSFGNRRPRAMVCRLRSVPMPRLYRLLLVFFITFLLVGICLTCYGFFYYESELSFTKAARLVGLMTFLVSLGLLIAVFVSMSSCLSRSVKSGAMKSEPLLDIGAHPVAHKTFSVPAICPSCSNTHVQELLIPLGSSP